MSSKTQYYLGIDIGGTNLRAVLLDNKFKEIESYDLATPKDNLDHFFIMLQALVDPLIKIAHKNKAVIKGIGVGIPGLYDYKKNKILTLPNLPILNGVNLASRLEEKYKLPIKIDNDANCFLTAEAKIGIGKNFSNIFGLTLGTDVGSSWWFNNQIYHGKHTCVIEVARMVIENPKSLEELYKNIVNKNAEELANRAYRGDIEAQEKFKKLGQYLGLACANVVNLIDPEIIVIGGQVIKSDDLFLSKVRKTVYTLAMHPEAKNIKIIKTKVTGMAGAKGAALLFD